MACRLRYLLLAVLLSQAAAGESLWVRYGWQSFVNAGDARVLALGGVPVAGGGTLDRLGNPAATDATRRSTITYAHQSRFAGIVNSDLLAFDLRPLERLPLGVVLLHEGVGDIPDTRDLLLDWGADGQPGTGDAGEGNGVLDEGERLDDEQVRNFRQRQVGLHLSSGGTWHGLNVGFAVKLLHHRLGEYRANGVGFDLGVTGPLWRGACFGLTLYDAVSSWLVWDSGTVERTAPSLAAGLSQSHVFQRWPLAITIYGNGLTRGYQSLEAVFSVGSVGIDLSAGTELLFRERFALRLGRSAAGAATAGIGLRWEAVAIDYAYRRSADGYGLGPNHYLSFALDPAWLKKIATTLGVAG